MKKGFLFLMCFANISNAGIPVWKFTPQTATSVVVSPSTSATVKYLVTNQSRKTHSLVLKPISGVTQDTSGSNCKSPFVLGYLESCSLTLNISGANLAGDINDGPIVCQEGGIGLECYRPSYPDRLQVSFQNVDSVLTVSSSNLLLKAGGIARVINITNGSTYPAYNVNYTISPSLPTGATISPASCGTISPGGVCTLTITPGSTPSTTPVDPGGSAAVPSVITLSGSNTNTVQSNISVLTIANIVENGLIFFIDDTTPNTQSITGKVVGQASNEGSTVTWMSQDNSFSDATSLTDGVANTNQIVSDTTYCPNTTSCAAKYCRSIGLEWYLPAINELQDIRTQLCPGGTCTYGGFTNSNYYWSSTNYNSGYQADSLFMPSTSIVAQTGWTTSLYKRCIRSF